MALVVPRRAPWKNAEELLARKRITEPLVAQPTGTSFMRDFQRGLRRRRIEWPQTVEATSAEIVVRHVAAGSGIGLMSLAALAGVRPRDVRVLPLTGFDPLVVGLLWRGELSALHHEVVEEVQRYACDTFPDWMCADVRK